MVCHEHEASEQLVIDEPDVSIDYNVRWRLYLSHALSAWNSRIFEFGAFLFLASIWTDDLLPASVYALARSAAAAALLPWLGSRLDRLDRLASIRLSLLSQRIPVALSCIGFYLLLRIPSAHDALAGEIVSLSALSILACVEKLGASTNTIAIERDWVVIIAGGNDAHLATLNAQMRRIDLCCKLVGPLAISLADSYSTRVAVVGMGAFTSVSVLAEYICIARVYRSVPGLRTTRERRDAMGTDHAARPAVSAFGSVTKYVQHSAFSPSLSLALLYLTVVSFSGQFITYLLATGFSSTSVALLRAVAAVFELSATWAAPLIAKRIGAVRTGLWSLNAQLAFIAGACTCLWFTSGATSRLATIGLITCTILSRTGLWGFDLSAQLIIQDEVKPDLRGTFSSLEASLQNIFEMLAFATTIIFPSTSQFKYPVAISAGAVTLSSAVYACFVRGRRGHLMHLDDCLCRGKAGHAGWTAVNNEDDVNTVNDDQSELASYPSRETA
ncbi:hypothetical protein B0A48_08050 [Cryoendolithus antarcticus]|uniref:Solute carrier family 40 member n=1 Tax=Cryoendolithus antarcticus TaxID=1507870 RepID=A0A1V8T127_9PEZI|nr:hypothetical protein B0A48_08050 [Cryoendolithus antarcticus]